MTPKKIARNRPSENVFITHSPTQSNSYQNVAHDENAMSSLIIQSI